MGAEGTAPGVSREAFQPWDLAFPRSLLEKWLPDKTEANPDGRWSRRLAWFCDKRRTAGRARPAPTSAAAAGRPAPSRNLKICPRQDPRTPAPPCPPSGVFPEGEQGGRPRGRGGGIQRVRDASGDVLARGPDFPAGALTIPREQPRAQSPDCCQHSSQCWVESAMRTGARRPGEPGRHGCDGRLPWNPRRRDFRPRRARIKVARNPRAVRGAIELGGASTPSSPDISRISGSNPAG